MRRFACLLALLGSGACTFPMARRGGIASGCISVETTGLGRAARDHWTIAQRKATAQEVDDELKGFPPAKAELSRGSAEGTAAIVAFAGGSTALLLGAFWAGGAFTDSHREPYALFLSGGGLAVIVGTIFVSAHIPYHEYQAYDLYNQAAAERNECPVRAAPRP